VTEAACCSRYRGLRAARPPCRNTGRDCTPPVDPLNKGSRGAWRVRTHSREAEARGGSPAESPAASEGARAGAAASAASVETTVAMLASDAEVGGWHTS
jgi:hypothetical protein